MWYFFKVDSHWIPAVDFGSYSTRVQQPYQQWPEQVSEAQKFFYQFFTLWYNSTLALALVEVNPRTQTQLIMQFGILVTNAFVQGAIFGIFIDLLFIVKSRDRELLELMETVEDTLRQLRREGL